jgi:1,4-alpha-glucan branching enzyme
MISQKYCTATTPMGANLVSDCMARGSLVAEQGMAGGGATFRVWAPRARAVYVNGMFGGTSMMGQTDNLLMAKDANGYWSGYLASAAEGDTYRFYVVGEGSSGYKRDPYARELANDLELPFPVCAAVIRAASEYPWHDIGEGGAGFRTPDYSDMVVYQLHIGTYRPARPGWASTFLDVVEKVEYLAALGVNVVQPLPVYEMEDSPSLGYPGLGYQGSDLYSPALDYAVYHPAGLAGYLATINRLLAAKGHAPMTIKDITPGYAQMKAMVDLLHVYGIAVVFDVVHNHAGGWGQTYKVPESVAPGGVLHGDDQSIYFWDRAKTAGADGNYDNNQSLYFTDQGFVGGLAFALWNADVRGFLHNGRVSLRRDIHAAGDEPGERMGVLQRGDDSGARGESAGVAERRVLAGRVWRACSADGRERGQRRAGLRYGAARWAAGGDPDGGGAGGHGRGRARGDERHRAGAVAGGVRTFMADGAVRGEPRHCEAGRKAAHSGAGGRLESSELVRAQQDAGGDGAAADRAGDSAAVYGAGVSGGQTVVPGPTHRGTPDLVGRAGARCGWKDGGPGDG